VPSTPSRHRRGSTEIGREARPHREGKSPRSKSRAAVRRQLDRSRDSDVNPTGSRRQPPRVAASVVHRPDRALSWSNTRRSITPAKAVPWATPTTPLLLLSTKAARRAGIIEAALAPGWTKRNSDWAPALAQCPITRATVAICGYRFRRGPCLNRTLRLAFGLPTLCLRILHTREVAGSKPAAPTRTPVSACLSARGA
jgi:hypothetical protein